LTFAPEGEAATQTYPAAFNYEAGSYEVELPPGKYRAICMIMQPDGALQSTDEARKKVYDLTVAKQQDVEISK